MFSTTTQHKWKVYQLDVKSTFPNGILQEEVHVEQPPSFEVLGHEHKVYRLKKYLYGLKQVPRALYSGIDTYLIKSGFCTSHEPILYTKMHEGKILIVHLYADDLLYTSNVMLEYFKEAMQTKFVVTDLGVMKYFSDIEIHQFTNGIFVGQQKYATDIIQKLRIMNCKPADTPIAQGTKLSKEDVAPPVDSTMYTSLFGSLLYLTSTRFDIMFAASFTAGLRCHLRFLIGRIKK